MVTTTKSNQKPKHEPALYDSKSSASKSLLSEPELKLYEEIDSRKASIKKSGTFAGIMEAPTKSAVSMRRADAIVEKSNRPEWQMTAVEKMDLVREGISKKNLENFKRKTNLDYDRLSAILLTTRATLINKKGEEHFSVALSERIVSIADLYSYGFDVFEDPDKFNEWIFRPNKALGGKPPFEMLDNHFGREEIKNVIGRIDYGVYS